METENRLSPPFPYFGGKSKVAGLVWEALGNPKHYIEPFFGSGAVLLLRQNYDPTYSVETVCDKDGFLANVWRSLQQNPEEVAKWCDWPVNHADLSARKMKLIENEKYLLENLIKDDLWCDAKLAGYWIWSASCWIGSGLTTISNRGQGVHAIGKIPHIGNGGKGIHAIGKRPHISDGGKGIHAIGQRPHISDGDRALGGRYNTGIFEWFRKLSERLRYVRVICGDWTRVCGGNWQDNEGDVGIFFDPPYGVEDRDTKLYHHDSTGIAKEVLLWAKGRGEKKSYRIVIAGYEEYSELLECGWTMKKWKTQGGYANAGNGKGKENRHRETLYFSPHCDKPEFDFWKL